MLTLENIVDEKTNDNFVEEVSFENPRNSWLLKHFVNSTAFLSVVTPLYAAMHNFIGVSDEVSMTNRVLVAGLTYLGIGYLYAKGLEKSRKTFRVAKENSELAYGAHDTSYSLLFNAATAPTFLYFGGENNTERLTEVAAIQSTLAIPTGWATGYVMDTMRDLMTIEKSSRWMPKFLRKAKQKTKEKIAAAAILASMIATYGIYQLPNKIGEEIQEHNMDAKISVVAEGN